MRWNSAYTEPIHLIFGGWYSKERWQIVNEYTPHVPYFLPFIFKISTKKGMHLRFYTGFILKVLHCKKTVHFQKIDKKKAKSKTNRVKNKAHGVYSCTKTQVRRFCVGGDMFNLPWQKPNHKITLFPAIHNPRTWILYTTPHPHFFNPFFNDHFFLTIFEISVIF